MCTEIASIGIKMGPSDIDVPRTGKEVSRLRFLCVCCIFGQPDKRPDKCEGVMSVRFSESCTSPPFGKSYGSMCLKY